MRIIIIVFFFSSRRRHTRSLCDWSSDVCSSDLVRSHEDAWAHDRTRRIPRRISRFHYSIAHQGPYGALYGVVQPLRQRGLRSGAPTWAADDGVQAGRLQWRDMTIRSQFNRLRPSGTRGSDSYRGAVVEEKKGRRPPPILLDGCAFKTHTLVE